METKKANMKEAVDSARALIENDKIFSPRSQLLLRKFLKMMNASMQQKNSKKEVADRLIPFNKKDSV